MGRLCKSRSAMMQASWQPPMQRRCTQTWRRARRCVLHGANSRQHHQPDQVLLSTQADRDGQALEFAQRYAASDVAASNAEALRVDMAAREVSPQIAKELRARQGTSTPFYFGVKTILKASSLFQ